MTKPAYSDQALDRANRLLSGRSYGLLNRRPDPPRGLTSPDPGLIRWEPPRETLNVSHYIVRDGSEDEIFAKVPVGQNHVYGLNGPFAFVSSFNDKSDLESIRVKVIVPPVSTRGLPFTTFEEWGAVGDGVTDDTTSINLAIADGRAIMARADKIYLTRPFALRDGLEIFGLPTATIKQKANTAVAGEPFIDGTGITDLHIEGIIIDGNRANQSGSPLGVTGLYLDGATNVKLVRVKTINTSGNGVGGRSWTNVHIEEPYATTWGLGNDYAAIYLEEIGATDPSTNVSIQGGSLDGSGSGSCIKLHANENATLSNVRVIGTWCKVGYPGPSPPYGNADALGIEVWSGPSGDGGNDCSGVVVACNKIESEFDGAVTYGRTWGISLSQVTDASVVGNVIQDCGVLAIEMLGSRLICTGNQAYNCGPITVILSSIMDLQSTFLISGNIIYTRAGQQYGSTPLSGIYVYCEGLSDLSLITVSFNHVSIQGEQRGIWFQNNGSGDLSDAVIYGNTIFGDSTIGSFGISISPDGLGAINNMTVAANHVAAVETAIGPGGTNGRYLWNIFGPGITNNYGNPGDATDMFVDVSNTEGVNFAPPSIQLRGRAAPVLYPSGTVALDQNDDTTGFVNAISGVDSSPNVWTWNRVNFGSELQGGILSVNSKWDGSPNWIQTSLDAYARAMFVIFGAGRFGIKFGDATNTDDAEPGDYAFRVDDNGGIPQIVIPAVAEIYPGISSNQFLKTDGTGKIVGDVAHSALNAFATSTLTLTSSYQDIPGVTVTLDQDGQWLIRGYITVALSALDGNCLARLVVNGVAQSNAIVISNAANVTLGHSQEWYISSATSGHVAKLQAKSNTGAGVQFMTVDCSITADWKGA